MKKQEKSLNPYLPGGKSNYTAPRVETIEIVVEHGFAQSQETESTGTIYYVPDSEWE